MNHLTAVKYPLFTLLVVLVLQGTVCAQLRAGFSLDKPTGCAPLAVSFTNNTTGASASATYSWDFGNGNTSVLRNPGAIFLQAQTYTVTLTVVDGSQSSVATQTVTVYQKPEVDFTASANQGCLPFPVTFTSSSTAGSGTISTLFWDFGDGATQQTTGAQAVHTYTAGVKKAVSLTVGNSYGCYNTKTVRDIVELLPEVKAAFSADRTFVCAPDEQVGFSNSSTGDGTLSYSWDFGDGTTSTQKDPQHQFSARGAFSVRLVVKSSLGCSDTLVKTAYLNIANFHSEITAPAVLCRSSEVQLRNTSTPQPTASTWLIDGVQAAPPETAGIVKHTFDTPGPHTLELTNHFGTCAETITKTINLKELPVVKGFLAEPQGICGAPITVNFRDTTAGAAAWGWNFERLTYPPGIQSTLQAPTKYFYGENLYWVTLWVTDTNGCQNRVEQMVDLRKPQAYIRAIDNNGYDGCESLVKKFKIETTEQLTSFTWHFSDGTTSTEAEPEHLFQPGRHAVWLTFTNNKGCSNTTYFSMDIEVWSHRSAEFVASTGTTVCGNLPVVLKRVPEDFYLWDYWLIDGQYYSGDYYNRFEHRFDKEGPHTISHVMYNEGCRDTVTKVDYIDVKFPFPKIEKVENTCDGNRDVVTFRQASRGAETWAWDFGDGMATTLNTDQPLVTHTYPKTGEYKVMLTTTNGVCTVKDSVMAYVLLKQHPQITADRTAMCMDEGFKYTLSNVEKDSYPWIWIWQYIYGYSYSDGTTVPVGRDMWDNWNYWVHGENYPYKGLLKTVEKGKDSIRVITMSPYHRCLDTSNYVPIKVLGAAAGFKTVTDNVCYTSPVLLQDTSNAYNTTIQSWQWSFGDGQTQTLSQGGTVQHQYAAPGTYTVTLKVADASGCTSTTATTVGQVKVNGPKAAFTASATNAALNTRVQFYNATNTANSPTTQYEWDFGDGTSVTDYNPAHTFTTPGNYRVKLTARNLVNGCVDTVSLLIRVAEFLTSFTQSTSFVANGKCPPVVARFVNTSKNYVQLHWDFGDGTSAENQDRPSHVYTLPGVYYVTLTAANANGLTGAYTDSVVVQQPRGLLGADVLHGCTAQSVTLMVDTSQGAALLWDLGDGTLAAATDTFYRHQYARAGAYRPSVLVADARGCTALAALPQPVVIDSLSVTLGNIPSTLCAPREVFFTPTVVSVSPDGGSVERTYHWDFGTGAAADTSNLLAPSFTFQQAGNYTVRLEVQTPYGCRKEVTAAIRAFQGLGAVINGPSGICEGEGAQFTGSTRLPGQPQWKWTFHDGTTAGQQVAPRMTYATTGSYPVQLLVDNGGCVDTLTTTLTVHPRPAVTLSAQKSVVCQGASVVLTASGGSTYSWAPATGLSAATGASVTAAPLQEMTYTVTAASDFGCTATQSLLLPVVHPLRVQLPAAATVCAGSSVQLAASGAATYQWTGNTAGLSATAIATPTALPGASTSYTVVGSDAYGCFSDTASIAVTVKPLPTVEAGAPVTLLAGATHTLQPTASADVVRWSWEPATYLSCSSCATPDATPMEPITYRLTVTNADGCRAADTVSIDLLCTESRVYIPNTFTPNRDGVNDVFAIKGYGIRRVKSLRIYNRWGQAVFERTDFQPGDRSAAWDGKYKGLPVPAGSYVYLVEMSCNEQDFTRKGTVTVVY